MDTLQVIKQFNPCSIFQTYVNDGRLTESMTLTDICDSEEIHRHDVTWLIWELINLLDGVKGIFYIDHCRNVVVLDNYKRIPLRKVIPLLESKFDELLSIDE